jgi:hypothetical protein
MCILQVGFDVVVEQSIYEAGSPSMGYGPQNPHFPLLAAQINEANISGWLAAGYHADDVSMYLRALYSVTSHPSLQLDLRYVVIPAQH